MKLLRLPADCEDLPQQIANQIARASAALRWLLQNDAADGTPPLNSSPGRECVSILKVRSAFTEVMRTSELLASPGAVQHLERSEALAEYQLLLREFKARLPQLQGWLLTERARIANRRSHSAAVQSWIETNQQTRRAQ